MTQDNQDNRKMGGDLTAIALKFRDEIQESVPWNNKASSRMRKSECELSTEEIEQLKGAGILSETRFSGTDWVVLTDVGGLLETLDEPENFEEVRD